jgi:glycosyltransferase involved in cell wall biosynthesis
VSASACVIARDAQATLDRCLASLAWCEECVVVVDPRSRDATEALARAAGARVVLHPYAGNVEQKNFALAQAKGEWVVALDADEALSPELEAGLRAWLAAPEPGCDGVELCRVAFHLGRWIRHGDFHPDWQLRVFRRERARWQGRDPHGRVRVPGRVRRLAGDLEHRSYASLSDQIARVQEWSRIEAERMWAGGRRARRRDLWLRPPARFLRAYLLRQGFRDGVPGFLIAAVTAFHVLLKYAKLWELAQTRSATIASPARQPRSRSPSTPSEATAERSRQ